MPFAIRVDNLGKRYKLGATHAGSVRELVNRGWNRMLGRANIDARKTRPIQEAADRLDGDSFWALRDVSFEVKPGEVVGIIGRNGSGKSTLLKILSQITAPTTGRVELHGHVASLLEVGTGFHPELSGRENIFLNGAILGMTKSEIRRKFDEIVAFAEIEEFIDTPVKRYSSGMYVRLAFAVAAHLDPEILIVDEVLAVGDVQFQKKCLGKMQSVARNGRTVLFVSHNVPAIQNLCDRCIYLRKGLVADDSETDQALTEYSKEWTFSGVGNAILTGHPGRTSNSTATMEWANIVGESSAQPGHIPMGGTARLVVGFRSRRELTDITFGFVVKDSLQSPVFAVNSLAIPMPAIVHPIRDGTIACTLKDLPLLPGTFSIDLYFGSYGENFDTVVNAIAMTVEARDIFQSGKLPPNGFGSIWLRAEWEVISGE